MKCSLHAVHLLLISGFAVVPMIPAGAQARPLPLSRILSVYRLDGSLQCQSAPGTPLATMASELTAGGAAILLQEKRTLPLTLTAECGTPTGQANYFLIELQDGRAVNLDPASPAAFRFWPFEEETVVICGTRSEPLATTVQTLKGLGVTPVESLVWRNPRISKMNCPGPVAPFQVFRIPATQIAAARKARFTELASRTPQQCIGTQAPAPRDGADPRVSGAIMNRNLVIADQGKLPEELRNKPFTLSYLVSITGTIDSILSVPALPAANAKRIIESSRSMTFQPGVFAGCYAPSVAELTVTGNTGP